MLLIALHVAQTETSAGKSDEHCENVAVIGVIDGSCKHDSLRSRWCWHWCRCGCCSPCSDTSCPVRLERDKIIEVTIFRQCFLLPWSRCNFGPPNTFSPLIYSDHFGHLGCANIAITAKVLPDLTKRQRNSPAFYAYSWSTGVSILIDKAPISSPRS